MPGLCCPPLAVLQHPQRASLALQQHQQLELCTGTCLPSAGSHRQRQARQPASRQEGHQQKMQAPLKQVWQQQEQWQQRQRQQGIVQQV
jgi:hypothetical protein